MLAGLAGAVATVVALTGAGGAPVAGVGGALGGGADAYCTGSYGGRPARAAAAVRFGVDPGLAE